MDLFFYASQLPVQNAFDAGLHNRLKDLLKCSMFFF